MISATQCRAARAMLNLSQNELAKKAQVSRATISDFERSERFPFKNNMLSIISVFKEQGIVFIEDGDEGAGVRLKRHSLSPNQWTPTK